MALTVGTWNVNGIRAREAQVREWLDLHRPEIFCLQEIKAKPEQIPEALGALADYWVAWHGAGGYSGVALGVRRDLVAGRPEFLHPAFDFETRAVAVRVSGIEVSSIYVPNGGKDFDAKMRFLAALRDSVNGDHRGDAGGGTPQPADRRRILCGDLNVALEDRDIHVKERKPGQIGARPEERALLAELIGAGLVDLGRALDPDNDGLFTWWPPWRNMRQRNIGWRIDYVLAGAPLAERAVSCKVLADFGTSDHAPVLATFDV